MMWFAALALAAAAPDPADKTEAVTDIATVRKTFDAYTRCVVRKNHKAAATVVLSELNNSEVLERYSRLNNGECLSVVGQPSGQAMMAIREEQMRHGLADALVRNEFRETFPKDIAQALPLTHRTRVTDVNEPVGFNLFAGADTGNAKAKALAYDFLSRFGECVVRVDPASVHWFLTQKPASKEESAALERVKPLLGRCLIKGEEFKLNLSMLRGTLAYNFYRLAHAPRGPLTAGVVK